MSRRPGPIKHGTIYAYKGRGCRCSACRKANRDTCRVERRRRGVLPLGNPCQLRGKAFASQVKAALAAGRSKSTISYHLNQHGNLDRLGAKPGRPNTSRCKPVRVGSHEWPSQSALDRALGVPAGTVSRWIDAGNLDTLAGAVMRMNLQGKAA
ncbi:hypothetical protein [Paracoccus indicus]|uniref:hypothetical protein n=1 Tax=Paracoccus indicus TaxID=2079229 RepID=UPI000D355C1C|nr:hypothetical protein [Paracoccus indicus]